MVSKLTNVTQTTNYKKKVKSPSTWSKHLLHGLAPFFAKCSITSVVCGKYHDTPEGVRRLQGDPLVERWPTADRVFVTLLKTRSGSAVEEGRIARIRSS